LTEPDIQVSRPRLIDTPVSERFAASVREMGGSPEFVSALTSGAVRTRRPWLGYRAIGIVVVFAVGAAFGARTASGDRIASALIAAGYAVGAFRLAVLSGQLYRRGVDDAASAARLAASVAVWGVIGAFAEWTVLRRGFDSAEAVAVFVAYAAIGAAAATDAARTARRPFAAAAEPSGVIEVPVEPRRDAPPGRPRRLNARWPIPATAFGAVLTVLALLVLVRPGADGTQVAAIPLNPVGTGILPTLQPSTAPPAGDPKAQGAAVDAVLDASIASRTKVNVAIDRVNKCEQFDTAISDLQAVTVERQSQIDSVSQFDLTAIPEGEQLRSMLKEAFGFSLAADRSFVSWAQAQQQSGCGDRGAGQTFYETAQQQSKDASDAKTRFLGVWNPVATRYGLRNRSSNDI
jgi:hypothetical protein